MVFQQRHCRQTFEFKDLSVKATDIGRRVLASNKLTN